MKNTKLLVLSAFMSLVVIATIIGCTGTGGILFPAGGTQTTRLLVADYNYERTLIFGLPVSTNANATVALGQPDLVTQGCNLTATGQCGPTKAVLDSSGNIWVSDWDWCRVVQYKPPFTNGMTATVVLGEPDFTHDNCGTGAADLGGPEGGLAFDSQGNLWVVDTDNSRVVEYKPPFSNAMSASVAIGQSSLTATGCGAAAADTLCFPEGIAFDAQGNMWVSDFDNCRILRYSPPFTTGMSANLVIGQSDLTSSSCNTTQTTNDGTYGLAFDAAGNLWAADPDNERVLKFAPPFSNGMAATTVIGQSDFTSFSSGTTASTFDFPRNVNFDSSGNMYVADENNSRVLVFAPPFTNGMSATKVLGAADLTTAGACAGTPAANTMCDPFGVTAVP